MAREGKKGMLENIDFQKIRCFEENPRDVSWTNHDRHFFIITDSARPVYCRYGDEVTVTPLLCTIVALTGQLTRDGGQKLKTITAGNKKFVFYLPFPFIFVAVSSSNIPESVLVKELQILEVVMYSVLSPGILAQVKRRPNFNIKKQSVTMERMFTSSLYMMDHSHWFIMNDCMPVAGLSSAKEKFASIVHENREKSILAVVIFHYGDVFLTVEDVDFHLKADDVLVLASNTYPSSTTFDSQWVPIWLPSHTEMVHMLTVDIAMFEFKMVLISNQICYTESVAEMVSRVSKKMQNESLKQLISPVPDFRADGLLHWMVGNRDLEQVYCPYMEVSPLSDLIYSNYAWTYEFLRGFKESENGEFYLALEDLTIFGVHSSKETVIAAAKPGTPAPAAKKLCVELNSFIENKRNTIFDPRPLKWT